VRSSIARFRRCRAQSTRLPPTNRPLDVHLASTTGAHSRASATYAAHSAARTAAGRALRQ
jgi:hypothetical protein